MDYLHLLLLLIGTLAPVKAAAALVGANNRTWLQCVFAVILTTVSTIALLAFLKMPNMPKLIVTLLVAGLIYRSILDTTAIRGTGIAILQIVLSVAFWYLASAVVPGIEFEIYFSDSE